MATNEQSQVILSVSTISQQLEVSQSQLTASQCKLMYI